MMTKKQAKKKIKQNKTPIQHGRVNSNIADKLNKISPELPCIDDPTCFNIKISHHAAKYPIKK